MDKKEKAKRINKIEAGLIDIIGYDRYDSEDYEQQKISAIKILAKRPGERIDKALVYATGSEYPEVSKAAFKALEKRVSYLDPK